MAQTNFTPILLYASSTPTNVPSASNLINSVTGSEIAINIADKNLFFKDSGGVVNTIPIRQSSTTSNGWLSATDWNTFNNKAPATSGASILYGNGAGGFSNVTIGTGVSFVGGTLSATGTGGTVTSVTGTSPIVSSGGTTPAISLATAYGDTLNPYASKTANYFLAAPNGSAGVPTFRAMVAADVPALAYVTSVSGTGTVNGITLTGTVTSSGSLTLGGTLSGIGNSQLTNSTISGVALGGSLFNLTAGTGVSFSAGTTYNGSAAITINATGTGGTVTSVAQSFTGGLISVAGSPITSAGTLALTVAGTSGGIPYFSSGTTWASSAALAANALMVGGGAGVAPSTVTTGTGVVTALGVNTGSAGAFVVNGGALGTPSSGTVTNLTGTASININGTVGATTPSTGAFTTVTASNNIKSATTISVGNATPSASGAGVTFPATQSASSDANTLDDYEEGTWTPVINGQNQTVCNYTKIGRLVYVYGYISISVSATGYSIIGLPFVVGFSGGGISTYNTLGTVVSLNAQVTGTGLITYNGSSGNVGLTNGSEITFSAYYQV
jgi:hypothetical protein